MGISVDHPAQRRDDKVTVSRFPPRAQPRAVAILTVPSSQPARGSHKHERSPFGVCAPLARAATMEDWNEKERSSRGRRKKNDRKVGGGYE